MLAKMVANRVYYIYYIVAHLFEVVDNVHVVYARLILVHLVVDVLDIVGAQLIAQVVDFTLFVVGAYDGHFPCFFYIAEQLYHVGHSLFQVAKHRVDVLVYQFGEVDTALLLAYEYLGASEAAVGYALDFADDVEHRGDVEFTFIGESPLGASVEVVGDFDFHAVGNLLIFLKPRE